MLLLGPALLYTQMLLLGPALLYTQVLLLFHSGEKMQVSIFLLKKCQVYPLVTSSRHRCVSQPSEVTHILQAWEQESLLMHCYTNW